MKIIVDVMSGDNAPLEILRGALLAKEEYGEDIILVGNETVIREVALANKLSLDTVSIVHAPSVITMEDRALTVVREKNDSSMAVGLHLLASGEGDAFVSAGNTGALLAGASLIVRRIRGIHRAGIATVLPFYNPCLLMDSGANLELTAVDYEQMAYMGTRYMQDVLHVDHPRVALLNNGSEPTKGSEELQIAYRHLKAANDINFVGNAEGRDIPTGMCDVLLTDGFTGNIILKYTEGMGKYMLQTVQGLISEGKKNKSATAKLPVEDLKKQFDASEYGGAPLLGIAKPVFKAHGSSDANAIMHAIMRAISFTKTGVNRDIAVYALDFDTRLKARKRRLAEEERAREKAEKKEAKRKKKQMNLEPEAEDVTQNERD